VYNADLEEKKVNTTGVGKNNDVPKAKVHQKEGAKGCKNIQEGATSVTQKAS
jgi:hypothetical protein